MHAVDFTARISCPKRCSLLQALPDESQEMHYELHYFSIVMAACLVARLQFPAAS